MELVAGLILGWTFLYLATGAYLLHRFFVEGRPKHTLDLVLLSFGLAVYSGLAVPFHLTHDPGKAVLLTRIQASIAPLLLALLFDFTMRFAGRDRPRERRVVLAVFAVGALLAALVAAGLAYDPARPEIHDVHLLGIVGHYYERAPTALGDVLLVWFVGITGASGWIAGRTAIRDRVNALPVFVGTAIFMLAVFHDVLVNAGWISSLYLGEHGFVFLLAGFVYTLLGRSVRLGADLRTRSAELEAANRELETVQRHLRQSHDSLTRTRDELHAAERLADLGRMAASLAHEIRNPLCVLTNVAAGLKRHAAADEAHPDERVLIEALDEEVTRLDRLVDDLLAFARPDKRSRARASLAMVADHAILAVLSVLPEPQRYEVRREYADPPVKAMIDVDRIRRALVNLLLNACQAMPDGGVVTVIVGRGEAPGSVHVGVRDTGEGIPPENLDRIFTPFFSTKPSGTGLGLPIVRSIAEDHDGRVEVDSAPNGGTTFWLRLYAESALPELQTDSGRRSIAP